MAPLHPKKAKAHDAASAFACPEPDTIARRIWKAYHYFRLYRRLSLPSLPASTSLFSLLAQDWLATVQLVLQADWQDAWHSPQPPWAREFFRQGFWMVSICFIVVILHFLKRGIWALYTIRVLIAITFRKYSTQSRRLSRRSPFP